MVREAMRRIRNLLASGVTTGPVIVGQDNVPRVQVRASAIETLTVQVVEQRGVASALPVGTPVVLSFRGGNRSDGAVTGSTAPKTRPPVKDGEDVALYGYQFTVWIKPDGIHLDAPDVFVTKNLHVGGDTIVAGEVTAKAGSAGAVTLSQHKHPTAAPGGPSSPTPGT